MTLWEVRQHKAIQVYAHTLVDRWYDVISNDSDSWIDWAATRQRLSGSALDTLDWAKGCIDRYADGRVSAT